MKWEKLGPNAVHAAGGRACRHHTGGGVRGCPGAGWCGHALPHPGKPRLFPFYQLIGRASRVSDKQEDRRYPVREVGQGPLDVWDFAALHAPEPREALQPCLSFPILQKTGGEGTGGEGGQGTGGEGGQGRGGEATAKRQESAEADPQALSELCCTCSPTGPGGPGKPLGPSSPFCPKRPCWPRGPGSPSAPCRERGERGDDRCTATPAPGMGALF